MGKISLEGIEIFAHHGYYAEERKKGNTFIVDITLTVDFQKAADEDTIDGTINYEQVYEIIKNEMGISAKLLEHLAQRIVAKVMTEFTNVSAIELSISKLDPPLSGKCKKAKVTVQYSREEFNQSQRPI